MEWIAKVEESQWNSFDVTEEMPDNDPRKMEYCLLSSLVADYSDEHFDLGTPTLQECLKERMFEQGLSQKDGDVIFSIPISDYVSSGR